MQGISNYQLSMIIFDNEWCKSMHSRAGCTEEKESLNSSHGELFHIAIFSESDILEWHNMGCVTLKGL